MKIILLVILLAVVILSLGCRGYESPAKHTALYKYKIGNVWGITYYTNNYTIENNILIVNGWWSEFRNNYGDGIVKYSMENVNYVGDNPDRK